MFFNINVCSIGFLIFPDLKQYQTTLFQKGTNEGKTMTVNPLCQSSQNSKRKKGKNKKKEKKMKNKKKHLTELKRHKKLKYSQKNRGSKAKQSKKRGWATKIWKVLVFKRGTIVLMEKQPWVEQSSMNSLPISLQYTVSRIQCTLLASWSKPLWFDFKLSISSILAMCDLIDWYVFCDLSSSWP